MRFAGEKVRSADQLIPKMMKMEKPVEKMNRHFARQAWGRPLHHMTAEVIAILGNVGAFGVRVYLKRLLIEIRVVANLRLPGLAEQDEFLEQKNVAEAFFLPERDQKLILAYQLALLLQINLYRIKADIKGKPLRHANNSRHRPLLVAVGYDCPLNTSRH